MCRMPYHLYVNINTLMGRNAYMAAITKVLENFDFQYTVESLYLEVRGTFVKTLSYRKFDV